MTTIKKSPNLISKMTLNERVFMENTVVCKFKNTTGHGAWYALAHEIINNGEDVKYFGIVDYGTNFEVRYFFLSELQEMSGHGDVHLECCGCADFKKQIPSHKVSRNTIG